MATKPASAFLRRKVKLTQRQAYVFDKLKAGEEILVTIHDGETSYSLTNGFAVGADIFTRLRRLEFLKPSSPGLFGDPQSYALAPYVEV